MAVKATEPVSVQNSLTFYSNYQLVHLVSTILSGVIGLLLLVTASIALGAANNYNSCYQNQRDNGDDYNRYRCHSASRLDEMIIGSSIALVASILQLLLSAYSIVKPSIQLSVSIQNTVICSTQGGEQERRWWRGLHVVVGIFCFVGFVLGLHYGDVNTEKIDYGKNLAFYLVVGIDWIFCIMIVVLSFFELRLRRDYQVGKESESEAL